MTDSPSTPTGVLRDEHTLILGVADRLDAALEAESRGAPLDLDLVGSCIEFFRLFADACHHGKEEDMLFPALEDQGMPHDAGPIAVMLYEHDLGRKHVGAMASAIDGARSGDADAGASLRQAASAFIDLIRAHIGKENHVLFAMADGMIVGPECATLCARYDTACARRFEGKTKEDLEELGAAIVNA